MRHEFGVGDGRTLSVVNDMERKSPVTITITISRGVEDRVPGHDQADDQKQHRHNLLDDGVQRVGLYVLEGLFALP